MPQRGWDAPIKGFLHCVRPPRMDFRAIILLKNAHNLGANDRTGKKFTLVLKTTYKKVYLKYQVCLPWSPSMCLASRNAIFGGGRRKKKTHTKKKSRQVHRGSRQRTGCPKEDGMPQSKALTVHSEVIVLDLSLEY